MQQLSGAIIGGRARWSLAAELVAAATPPARAQGPDTLNPGRRVGLTLPRLGAGQLVRIHACPRAGWLVGRSATTNNLAPDGSGACSFFLAELATPSTYQQQQTAHRSIGHRRR